MYTENFKSVKLTRNKESSNDAYFETHCGVFEESL